MAPGSLNNLGAHPGQKVCSRGGDVLPPVPALNTHPGPQVSAVMRLSPVET